MAGKSKTFSDASGATEAKPVLPYELAVSAQAEALMGRDITGGNHLSGNKLEIAASMLNSPRFKAE